MGTATADVVVLGAGPAGLAATLELARSGADVVLLEAGEEVGGLCRTLWRDGHGLDLGGHIPFVRTGERRAWMADLLGPDMVWVPRPVACVRDGRITPGRYLDQRPADPPDGAVPEEAPAPEALAAIAGRSFADRVMRPYLEKVDGLPLERVPAARPLRLLRTQAAPEGFWFAARGIGQLMDRMAEAAARAGADIRLGARVGAVETAGGRVTGVQVAGDGTIATDGVVASLPPGLAASLVRPEPPPEARPELPMRAVAIVYLEIDRERVGEEAWVQVDDPRVPFGRVFEPRNWSAELAPPGRTALGMECYCMPSAADPVWGLDDDALTARCAAALADPLGWIDGGSATRPLGVVRIPRAYPLPDAARAEDLAASARWLDGVGGLALARGSDVLDAVDAGERAARSLT